MQRAGRKLIEVEVFIESSRVCIERVNHYRTSPCKSHCQQLPTRAYGYGNITSINYSDIRHAEAEQTLADQRRFCLDADQWNAFVAALDRPIQPRPRLRRLFAEFSISKPSATDGRGCTNRYPRL